MRDGSGRSSFRTALAEHFRKKCFWVDAMRSVVGAGVNTAWLFQVRAEIARRGFLLNDRFLAAGIFQVVRQHFEGMQIDIAVRTIARAKPAADAPILDDNLEGIAAANRADRA